MSSVVLVPNTQGVVDFKSESCRAAGWYGYNSNLVTVAFSTQNFKGKVYLEATLALKPAEKDWFPIRLTPLSDYLSYPLLPFNPTGQNGGDTGTSGYSFKANVLYIRARVVRSDLYNSAPSLDEIELLGNMRIVISL